MIKKKYNDRIKMQHYGVRADCCFIELHVTP